MDQHDNNKVPSMAIGKSLNSYHLVKAPSLNHSAWLEIRLFYVRISPCVIDSVPDRLNLRHPRREIGVSLEINGSCVPASEAASLTLRRDRVSRDALEVTYVSTDGVRITGGVEFEVYENEDMIMCGSLERTDDSRTGWSMDCHTSIGSGCSAFFQPKLGVSAPSFEVYIAGCCSGVPVILTKTIQVSPRRRVSRHAILDAIPEDDELDKEHGSNNGLVRHRQFQMTGADDNYEGDGKMGNGYYSEEMYTGEDGQLTWFNAGVRVGVGIGLGMCVGVGIGVGLLMRSYQATTRNFRRRFF